MIKTFLPVAAALVTATSAVGEPVDFPRFPALSPDGSTVVFSWRGDVWSVDADGGAASRLTSHPADDLAAAWSPDGTRIAFESSRDSGRNVYTMTADGGDVRVVTRHDGTLALSDYGTGADGAPAIMLSAAIEGDVYRSSRPYVVDPDGGDIRRAHDAFGSHPVASPDGSMVAFTRGNSSWARRHYRGPDNRDVWVHDRSAGTFARVTIHDGNDGQARWLDDDTLLFLSDRELDSVNLYRIDLGQDDGDAERLTSFEGDDIRGFDLAGERVVLTVWDTMYVMDLGGEPRALTIDAPQDAGDDHEWIEVGREVSEAALSPDGKVMAVVAYGEIYVRDVVDGSPARRVTNDHGRERAIAWSPDGLTLYFTSDRDGTEGIYGATVSRTRGEVHTAFTEQTGIESGTLGGRGEDDDDSKRRNRRDRGDDGDGDDDETEGDDETESDDEAEGDEADDLPPDRDPKRWRDALEFAIEPVVVKATDDREPSPSPDGSALAFRRGRGDLVVLDLDTGEERTLATGWDIGLHWSWRSDGAYIAYAQSDMDFNMDIFVVPADGSAPAVNVSQHPDNDREPQWTADGRMLVFTSERVDEQFDVWAVYLDRDLESLTDEELDRYFENAAKAAKKRKPLSTRDDDDEDEDGLEPPDLDGAFLRVRRLTSLLGDESGAVPTPGGDRILFRGQYGSSALMSIKYDGSDRKTVTSSGSLQHLSLDGSKAVLVTGGRAATVPVSGGSVENVDISGRMQIDLEKQARQKFLEAARGLGESYYHPTMNGVDWPAATAKYLALAAKTRTSNEFDDVANRFLGELNGSHLAIRSPRGGGGNSRPYGRLGIDSERVADGYEVTRVIDEGPAATGPMALRAGDVIVAVEGNRFDANDTLVGHLHDRSGRETLLTVQRDGGEIELFVTPTSYGSIRQLRYLDWRRRNAERVAEWSNGRLGYIHIQGMNQPSLDVFERDIYAAAHGREGLIVDVRNNGGGWTTDRLLSSIMVVPHAYTIPRGADADDIGHYPQDRLFIQRYTLPMNALCNERSFSNAEIFSHAFKALGRGTLVGQQTYGGVISTGGWSLIDGTFVRRPFRGWFLNDGTDMELNGAMPDILVPQTPEAESRDDDEQLRTAVDDLLRRIDAD